MQMKIGTTFSYQEAKYLKLNWQETLGAILKLGLNPVRIGVYWSEVEKTPGEFDFSIQDEIVDQISRAKTEIILEVGMKAPRWPEFYLPKWLEKETKFSHHQTINESDIGEPLFQFLEKTIKRYRKRKYVRWVNVENEPLTPSGPDQLKIDLELLRKEVKLTRNLTEKPIILNSLTELHPLKRLIREKIKKENSLANCYLLGDILGISAYPKFPNQPKITNKKHWQFLEKWLKKARQDDKDAWIAELQAEPWEKDGTKNFKDPFGNPSCNPKDVEHYFIICQKLGFQTILLWGTEFWYRCLKENNPLWWQTVSRLIQG